MAKKNKEKEIFSKFDFFFSKKNSTIHTNNVNMIDRRKSQTKIETRKSEYIYEQMATAVLFFKRAPFVLYLSLLPAFATACSCHTKKKPLID